MQNEIIIRSSIGSDSKSLVMTIFALFCRLSSAENEMEEKNEIDADIVLAEISNRESRNDSFVVEGWGTEGYVRGVFMPVRLQTRGRVMISLTQARGNLRGLVFPVRNQAGDVIDYEKKGRSLY